MYSGVEVREDPFMVDAVEDWTRVRSPSRAARRRRQGHRQNIATVNVPKPDIYVIFGRIIVGHPVTIAKFMAKVNALPTPFTDGRAESTP